MSKKRSLVWAMFLLMAITIAFLSYQWANAGSQASSANLLASRLQSAGHDDSLINFAPLREQIRTYLDGLGIKSSFYFEYLFTGTTIEAGDNQELIAASLMKIPLVMNLYKDVEKKELSLDQEATITDPEVSSEFGDLWKQGAGTVISLRDAVKLTLENSDNTAANVIFDAVKAHPDPNNSDALHEIDAPFTLTSDNRIQISARAYSSILKCLYLACFLSKDHSAEILDYLTKSKVDNGLVAGLPGNVLAAHKIGTFSNINESDCGIVYAPKRTYLFCAMLQEQFDKADPHIRDLSKMVYDYVVSQ